MKRMTIVTAAMVMASVTMTALAMAICGDDADNDAWSDIIVCNGIYRDVTDQDFIDFFANDVVKQMAANGFRESVDKVIEKMPSVPIPNKAFRNAGGLRFTDESRNWGLDKPSFSKIASSSCLLAARTAAKSN